MKRFILPALLGVGALIPVQGEAQVLVDFESNAGLKGISMYDCWENSPFRTGELKGNCKIVDNPQSGMDEISGRVPNSSAKVLGAQRSRFGSNTFGVRVDLQTPFDFSTSKQYVHVNLLRPVSGRVMLVGLGRRRDWQDQPADVEQFWVMCSNTLVANSWCDAVFEIEGSGNIDIHSLVLVPECESPHAAKEDFLFYIDNISVTNNKAPNIQTPEPYAISVDKKSTITNSSSSLTAVSFTSGDGTRSVPVNQNVSRLLYKYVDDMALTAKPGEEVQLSAQYSGATVNAYLYLDTDNNGRFDIPTAVDGKISLGQDLMSYSYLNGVNSSGVATISSSYALPKFTVPANLKPGAYRLRLKLDLNSADPAGDNSQSTLLQSGSITDMVLFVRDDQAVINDFQLNGEVLAENGDKLSSYKVDACKPFTVKMNPEKGFYHSGAKVVYGYNIDSESNVDKHGNVQYLTANYRFESETYQIPATNIVGSVRIEGKMTEDKGENWRPIDPREYGLNFPETLTITRTDRVLNNIEFSNGSGTKIFTAITSPKTVWQNLTAQEPFIVKPGDVITTKLGYVGSWMHIYQYIDWNRDKVYDNTLASNGVPAGDKELVAYTHYQGRNSLGATSDPAVTTARNENFTIPADMPGGIYNARLKIDWDNIDPKGQYGINNNDINNNAGYIVDFYIQVEGTDDVKEVSNTQKLDITVVQKGVVINSAETVNVEVYDATGIAIYKNANFKGSAKISLNPGVYIINGIKVAIK